MSSIGPCGSRILVSLTLVASCSTCPDYPCKLPFDVLANCADAKNCSLGGAAVTNCHSDGSTPACPLWHPPSGKRLSIPFDAATWVNLDARDDLHIDQPTNDYDSGAWLPDFTTATLLFDGSPATDCLRDQFSIVCPNVPHSVARIDFQYDGNQVLILYFNMHDDECEQTHHPCPN